MDDLKSLIRKFEGLRLESYQDSAGVWTIGYGSTGKDIMPSTVWSLAQCEARMATDSAIAISAATRLCPGLSGNRLAAVADFVYNLGAGRLAGSTLRKLILAGKYDEAALEFDKWTVGGGRHLPGLVARRAAERSLFENIEQ